MAEAQDVETLKRRGRRRLVGAVALVLAAVIVLPMVFDAEPKQDAPSVSVRIPGEGESGFAPRLPPKPAVAAPAKRAAPKPPGTQYVVQVGVFARPDQVMATLAAAKLPYYTESLNDRLTRVRAGPFQSKEAAEKALGELKRLGLEPGAVITQPG